MSKKPEIEIFHPSENLVVTDTVDIRKKIKKDILAFNGIVQVPMLTIGAIIAAIDPYIDLLEGSLVCGGIGLAASLFATLMTRSDAKGEKVYKELELSKFSILRKHLPVGKMKEGNRLLLETFSIREASDIEIRELKANTEKVDEAQATHTINHYIVKDKNGFRLEQEAIPNHEAIWDASANAMVEIHSVNEAKRRYTFEPVF